MSDVCDRQAGARIARVPTTSAVAIVAVAGLGIVLLWYMTTRGIGTSPDSVHYIRMARGFLGTAGESLHAVPSSQFPPFYAVVLAATGVVGADPLDGARWLHVVLFAANVVLVGLAVAACARKSWWTAPAGAALTATAAPVVRAHGIALSEPLFLTLALVGFFLLARYLERATRSHLLGAALCIGLAVVTRYAGAACLATGVVAILLLGRVHLRRRALDALSFAVVCALPAALWIARNLFVVGSSTNRAMAVHPVGMQHAREALQTVSGWLLIPPSASDFLRLGVWFGVVLGCSVLLTRRFGSGRRPPRLLGILLIFLPVYATFLAASISFFDANTPLDDRILLPVFLGSWIVFLASLDGVQPPGIGRSTIRAVPVLLFVFVAAHLSRTSGLVTHAHASGLGLSSIAWQTSETLAQVRHLPENALVYSNAPEVVYLHAHRYPRTLPRLRFLMTQLPNERYGAEMAIVSQHLRDRCGVIVYLRSLTQKSMPSELDVRRDIPTRVIDERTDGVILGSPACLP